MFSLSRFALVLLGLGGVSQGFASTTSSAPTSLPLTFEENRGQAPPQYGYVLHRGLNAYFFRQGAEFILPTRGTIQPWVRLEFLSTNPNATLTAEEQLEGQSNYLMGSDPAEFIRHVPTYGSIRYQDIYRGVTLDFYGNGNDLEHDFTIAPHASPSAIAFRWRGAKSVKLAPSGDLLVRVADGTLILKKPVAYQLDGRKRDIVAADFRLNRDGNIGFQLGAYDLDTH